MEAATDEVIFGGVEVVIVDGDEVGRVEHPVEVGGEGKVPYKEELAGLFLLLFLLEILGLEKFE